MTRPLAVTPGDPAGIGPDLVLALAAELAAGAVAVFADPDQLARRAGALGREVAISTWRPGTPIPDRGLAVVPVPQPTPVAPGRPSPDNAPALLAALEQAVGAVSAGHCAALVTGPLSKSVIAGGIAGPFTGHTELLARLTDSRNPVMMLVGGGLRVALVTTHVPLREVPDMVTAERLGGVVRTVATALERDFACERPRILVTGLNPHAGEEGHLGREEVEVIGPALEAIRGELGKRATVEGPVAADTAFLPDRSRTADAVVAMYHDQGLAPLKRAAFGRAVNVTLGLPLVRTSVDHGTAFELAGTGSADPGSFREALTLARELAANRARTQENRSKT